MYTVIKKHGETIRIGERNGKTSKTCKEKMQRQKEEGLLMVRGVVGQQVPKGYLEKWKI